MTSYHYSLGDRLAQNNVHYTLDLNAGLIQVLDDGENTYLYGNGRIAQTGSVTEYFLGDALGSVRQLTNDAAEITLTKAYEPYGEEAWSYGEGQSAFAFTGEAVDANGLVYLRARYYASDTGRFLSRDTWEGDVNSPMSLNRWMYVNGDPINRADPTGHYGPDVHFTLTEKLVREQAKIVGITPPNDKYLASLIADGDLFVDHGTTLNPISGCQECHFMNFNRTNAHIEYAILSKNPFLFGAALHQVQDWYSHWGEGYTPPLGHALDTIGYKTRTKTTYDDFCLGGHYVHGRGMTIWSKSPFDAHPRDQVIQDIKARNPGINLSNPTDDELLDLFLRKEITDPNMDLRIRERSHFGFNTDMDYPSSARDLEMRRWTSYYVKRFLFSIDVPDNQCINWTQPEESVIRSMLTK